MKAGLSVVIQAVALLAAAPALAADDYPNKPVRMVSPYPPGSSADIIGRIFAPRLTEALGKQFVVDNRPGASGNIAADMVAHAAPDGYTQLLLNTSIIASQPLYKNLPFDVARDFRAAGMLGIAPYLLVVNIGVPAKTVKELVVIAKARDGKMIYASTGVGGGLHLSMELLMMQTGIHMVHVPYKGSAASVPDLISGQVETMFGSVPALMPHVRSGRIRALGVSSAKRVASLPDIPTLSESGLPGYDSTSITTLAVPTATPAAIVAKLNAVINQSVRSGETRASLANQGTEAVAMTPEETTQFIRSEVAKWNKVIAVAGVKGE